LLAPAALAIPPAAVPAKTPVITPVVSGDTFSHPATARQTTRSIATVVIELPFIEISLRDYISRSEPHKNDFGWIWPSASDA
jgi:hypothetical protein